MCCAGMRIVACVHRCGRNVRLGCKNVKIPVGGERDHFAARQQRHTMTFGADSHRKPVPNTNMSRLDVIISVWVQRRVRNVRLSVKTSKIPVGGERDLHTPANSNSLHSDFLPKTTRERSFATRVTMRRCEIALRACAPRGVVRGGSRSGWCLFLFFFFGLAPIFFPSHFTLYHHAMAARHGVRHIPVHLAVGCGECWCRESCYLCRLTSGHATPSWRATGNAHSWRMALSCGSVATVMLRIATDRGHDPPCARRRRRGAAR